MAMERIARDELRATLRATGVGTWSYDLGKRVLELDEACRELFEVPSGAELTPENMNWRIHPDDLKRYWTAARTSMATGSEFSSEYRVVRRDGSTRFISGRGRFTRGEDGSGLLTGVCVDVTERVRLGDELQATQWRMQHLADNVPGLFSYLDENLIIRFLSSQYDQWYGYSRDRHLGQHVSAVIGAEAWGKREPLYRRCLAGEVVTYEEQRTMVNGDQRYYGITYRPARDDGDRVTGVLSLAIDITGRRKAEQALEAKTRELERSNQDLEQFAYVASHDLKAPLRAIEILVEWLGDDLGDQQIGDVQPNLALLRQRTARLHRLLDDLLAYSRAGRRADEISVIDSRLLVQDLFVLLSPPAGMTLEADPSLPVFRAQQAPLEQVLRNLINNAVKHHPTQSGTIRVCAQDQPGEVLFAVEDDGSGIPPEYAEKVFHMFQTLKPRDEVEGSGMGLAIVKRIVELQGGRIWLHDAPGGRGTVFKFTWKKLPAEGAESSVREEDHERADTNRAYLAG